MPNPLTPAERRAMGRIGGLARWSQDRDGAERQLAAARRAREAQWATPQERALYFERLKLASLTARRKRKEVAMAAARAVAAQEERAPDREP